MKNKDTSNLIFSAFLVTAFISCTYFFSGFITESTQLSDASKIFAMAMVYAVFGLVIFYATRVGDGKQVKRFSPATLTIMVLPAFYIILAGTVPNLPFSEQIAQHPEAVNFAAVAFGYGMPYTFLSGYELDKSKTSEKTEVSAEEQTVSDSADKENNEKGE